MIQSGKAYLENPLHQINWGEVVERELTAGEISEISETNKPFFEEIPIAEFGFSKDIIMETPVCYKPGTKILIATSTRKMRLNRKLEYHLPYSKIEDNILKKLIIDGVIEEINNYPKQNEEMFIQRVIEARHNHIISPYVQNHVDYIFIGVVKHK